MGSFVGSKDNKQWIWLALDVGTREIVGVYVGDRSREGAQGLWDALPGVYRQCAVAYTDFWRLTMRSFLVSDINVWVKTVARPVILSGLTAHCVNEGRV